MFGTNNKMTASEMGKLGAAKTNTLLTKEGRSKAAKKGWRLKREREKADGFTVK